MIPFNKPHLSGNEIDYIKDAVLSGKISGNGKYTKWCQEWFEKKYGFKKCLLTTSCTDALEMAALLINIQPGDEVIVPSFTFVSSANAFELRGAKIIFSDSRDDHPGINENSLECLITSRTKAIVPVHYAGVAVDMDKIMDLAEKHNLFVIEDAAQSIDSYYYDKNGIRKPLGSIGHMSTFSFHETKNIISGEGGMLVVNDPRFFKRAEIIHEKGTNRSSFFRGEVDKYSWVDIGSSFLPSEIISAFLWAQIEQIEQIQERRISLWNYYYTNLLEWSTLRNIKLPFLPDYATNNAHMFYVVLENQYLCKQFIEHLKLKNVLSVFHYQSLHKSPYFSCKHDGRDLPCADKYSDCLARLPMFYDLDIQKVVDACLSF